MLKDSNMRSLNLSGHIDEYFVDCRS